MGVKERKGIAPDYVFDIETSNWDTFVVGGLMDAEGSFYAEDWREEERFARLLLSLEGTLWAHNGGRYDTIWLLGWAEKLGVKARIHASSARITLVEFENLKVRDSAALVPLKLADAAKIAGVEKLETGMACSCPGKPCGGYCAIRREMTPAQLAQLVAYMKADCKATMALLRRLEEYAVENDLDLRGTIGASAYATAARWLALPDADWSSSEYHFARRAYFGGRVQVFQPSAERGFRYDINSSYPAALSTTNLPYGPRYDVEGSPAKRAYRKGFEGAWEVTIDVPRDMHVPPLPVRVEERVWYPTGTLNGTWTGIELRYAESLGCEIRKFYRALVWRDQGKILKPFVDRLWELRATAGKATPLGKWLKLYSNSLTGKLAQRPDHDEVRLIPDASEVELCPAKRGDCPERGACKWNRCCFHRCTGRCKGFRALNVRGTVWKRPLWRIPHNGHVIWSAYLTAKARIELHKQLVADGDGGRTALYCDTDSVYATTERTYNIGTEVELGKWLPEGELRDFRALAPKTYTFIDAATGKRKMRAKGVPEDELDWNMLAAGEPVPIRRGVVQFRTAVRGQKREDGSRDERVFRRRDFARAVKADGVHFGDRLLKGHLTHPYSIDEIVSRVQKAQNRAKAKKGRPRARQESAASVPNSEATPSRRSRRAE